MGVVVRSRPEFLQAIVGTAGHVDHGKTSLVKLLTGCETDSLPEEQARGMSIDLGFAPCLLHGRRVVGIVDVPGHKDFIRNMVAGASSIDVLLLVVAADDGVMPQTDEHVRIIKLLRAPQVMVALTKIDVVAPDMLELAKQDVAAFMTRAGFPDAPIIPVSNKTGEGIPEVRDLIDLLVDRIVHREAGQRAFRMSVERVFAVKGYGTVVTGIPSAGQVKVGDRIELLPGGRALVARTIQCYKHESDTAIANCCSAINVRDIDAEGVDRGMQIALPGIYRATSESLAVLHNVTDDHVFKRRFSAMFHSGTAAVEASFKLLDAETLPQGSEAVAHIALTLPVTLASGDRFLIRNISPAATLGGGVVLSARAHTIRKLTPQVLARLGQARLAAQDGDWLAAELLAGPDAILPATEMARLTQCPSPAAQQLLKQAEGKGQIVDLGGGSWVVASRAAEAVDSIAHALERYHSANPYTWGMTPAHVCEHFGIDVRNFQGLSQILTSTRVLAIKNGRLALRSFQPPVSTHLLELRERVLEMIQRGGVNAPARGNLMKELDLTEAEMRVLSKLLTEDGTVLYLDGNFMLKSVYEQCRTALLSLLERVNCVDLNRFRDAIGSNRKMAVAMLDAFDAEGLTRRIGEGRVLAKPSVIGRPPQS